MLYAIFQYSLGVLLNYICIFRCISNYMAANFIVKIVLCMSHI